MKILIVNNNLHIRTYPQGLFVRVHSGLKNFFLSIIKSPKDLSEADLSVDRVILTGSTAYIRQEKDWMIIERGFIEKWMRKGIPVLGICFGSQLLVRHIFGEKAITALPFPINGSILVKQEKESLLFKGVPKVFGAIATHYEGINIPTEHIIASTDVWPQYAFSLPGHVYGIQFHPELCGPIGRFIVFLQRILYDRHVFQDFSIKTSARHGSCILKNFIHCTSL